MFLPLVGKRVDRKLECWVLTAAALQSGVYLVSFLQRDIDIFVCVYVWICIRVYAMYVWGPAEANRGHWVPWICSFRWLWATWMPEGQETLNLRFIFKLYDQRCVVNSHFCLIISLFSFSLSANQNTLKSLLVQVQKYSKTVEKGGRKPAWDQF